MQFAVLILTKSPVSSALPCQQKKNPVITRERGLTGSFGVFYLLPATFVGVSVLPPSCRPLCTGPWAVRRAPRSCLCPLRTGAPVGRQACKRSCLPAGGHR